MVERSFNSSTSNCALCTLLLRLLCICCPLAFDAILGLLHLLLVGCQSRATLWTGNVLVVGFLLGLGLVFPRLLCCIRHALPQLDNLLCDSTKVLCAQGLLHLLSLVVGEEEVSRGWLLELLILLDSLGSFLRVFLELLLLGLFP